MPTTKRAFVKLRIYRETFPISGALWMVTDQVHEEGYDTWPQALAAAADWIRNG